uniref:Ovule protein n=1 Tax=Heligmosomoides polygyrus TaxID=6339 RepID=A0A183GQV2_HELPZ
LAEFEMLEQEIEEGEEGLVRTDYIVCRDERIQLARLRQRVFAPQQSRPKPHFPLVRVPSSNDLVMKRLLVSLNFSSNSLHCLLPRSFTYGISSSFRLLPRFTYLSTSDIQI